MFELVPGRMNVVRRSRPYNTFSMLDSFFNDEIFNEKRDSAYRIRTDIKELEKEYVLSAELPGFKKEDITLEVDNNVLTIKANRESEENEEKVGYVRRERRCGQFERCFNLDGIAQDEIAADYKDGILQLTLPKQDVKIMESKKIAIK